MISQKLIRNINAMKMLKYFRLPAFSSRTNNMKQNEGIRRAWYINQEEGNMIIMIKIMINRSTIRIGSPALGAGYFLAICHQDRSKSTRKNKFAIKTMFLLLSPKKSFKMNVKDML